MTGQSVATEKASKWGHSLGRDLPFGRLLSVENGGVAMHLALDAWRGRVSRLALAILPFHQWALMVQGSHHH